MDQADKLREKVGLLQEQVPSSRVIVVTSGKGGVGKTSISVNLALQLQERGKRVIILDADFGLANVEIMLGIRPQHNLSELIYNNRSIEEIVTEGPNSVGFISGGSGVQELVNLDKDKLKGMIAQLVKLDSMYDVVIIDTGAGISDSVIEFVLSSPEVLLVVTPEPTSITDAYSLLKTVNRKKEFVKEQKSIKVIANRVESLKEAKEIYDKISVVVSKFLNIQLEYLGHIPLDKKISNAVVEQKPISLSNSNSESVIRIREICNKLLDESYGETEKIGIAKVLLNFVKSKKNNR